MRRPSAWRASPLPAGDRSAERDRAGGGRARGRRACAQDLPRHRCGNGSRASRRRSARPISRSTRCCASGSRARSRPMAGCRRKPRTIRAGSTADAVWIVDPIDGTRAYLDGRDDWVVSVALAAARPAAAGGALRAGHRRILPGGRRRGRDLQRRADPGRARRPGSKAPSCSAPSASSAGWRNCIRRWCRCRASVRWRCGSRASRMASVDITIVSGNSHDWDLAAADLLVHEAGGAADRHRRRAVRPTIARSRCMALLVAAGRSRHGTALALMRERRAQFV